MSDRLLSTLGKHACFSTRDINSNQTCCDHHASHPARMNRSHDRVAISIVSSARPRAMRLLSVLYIKRIKCLPDTWLQWLHQAEFGRVGDSYAIQACADQLCHQTKIATLAVDIACPQ